MPQELGSRKIRTDGFSFHAVRYEARGKKVHVNLPDPDYELLCDAFSIYSIILSSCLVRVMLVPPQKNDI